MHSNNDTIDPKWNPPNNDDFEAAYVKWYNGQPKNPNAVEVRLWAHQFWKKEREINKILREALQRYQTETVPLYYGLHILEIGPDNKEQPLGTIADNALAKEKEMRR